MLKSRVDFMSTVPDIDELMNVADRDSTVFQKKPVREEVNEINQENNLNFIFLF
jgi:hypothetical protein